MLSSLPLPSKTIALLLKHGFERRQEVVELNPSRLSKELSLDKDEALKIWKTAKYGDDCDAKERVSVTSLNSSQEKGKSALQLLKKKSSQRPIFTLCQQLDVLLGNGVQLGEVTEFCGIPGAGKTQLGMQLACNVQIPRMLGGTGGTAVYIDTEGSFVPRRAQQIAQGLQSHLLHITEGDEKRHAAALSLTWQKMLGRIYCYRVYDLHEQLACIKNLPVFLESHPEVKLIVLDSIAFHFRHGFTNDFAKRHRMLTSIAQTFLELSTKNELAVVIMNQVTTKFKNATANLVPALGVSWLHSCTNRIMMHWKHEKRFATVLKSPSRGPKTVEFAVAAEGIRDAGGGQIGPKRQKTQP